MGKRKFDSLGKTKTTIVEKYRVSYFPTAFFLEESRRIYSSITIVQKITEDNRTSKKYHKQNSIIFMKTFSNKHLSENS